MAPRASSALVAVVLFVGACSSDEPSGLAENPSPFELALPDDIALRDALLRDMSDEELEARIGRLERERAAENELGARRAEEILAEWSLQACPAGGSIDEAFFDPQPLTDDVDLDLVPHESWLGYEVVRVADLVLPTGALLESGGEYLGDEATEVPIAEPGTYPYFMALANYDGYEIGEPALAQLVLDAASPPVRWEDDDRFGFGTDAGQGWIGSRAALVAPWLETGDNTDFATWLRVVEAISEPTYTDAFCTTWAHEDGANFVIYSNGFGDGFFPAAAGYDAEDRMVAITWFFGHTPWVLAGIPGEPPEPVKQQIECLRVYAGDC